MTSARQSLQQRMEATNNRATGFDYMRVCLAVAVIVWHTVNISYGDAAAFRIIASPARPLVTIILPLFFALSGFLVAGSLERSKSLSTFVGLRVIRIVPALAVESALSALILGPLLTSLPIAAYFRDPKFYSYFLNIVGRIHYMLPGMFHNNPTPDLVNGQLWTVPWELKCYLALTLLALVTIAKRPVLFLLAVIALVPAYWFHEVILNHRAVDPGGVVPGGTLVLSFLAAVALYNLRRVVPWSAALFWSCLVVTVSLYLTPFGDYFVPFPAAYCAIYLGLCNPKKIALLRGADYSYGLFLYGYAVQQSVAWMGPWAHHWYINLLLTIPLVTVFAAFSWHIVEKPALKLRRVLPHIEAVLSAVGNGGRTLLPMRGRNRTASTE